MSGNDGADEEMHTRSHTSLPGNTRYQTSDHVQRGISIITHCESNNPQVYLSPSGSDVEMFPLALAFKNLDSIQSE